MYVVWVVLLGVLVLLLTDSLEIKTSNQTSKSFSNVKDVEDFHAAPHWDDHETQEQGELIEKEDALEEEIAPTTEEKVENANTTSTGKIELSNDHQTTGDDHVEFEVPFMVYDSLQYRRVCAPVGTHSSIVCRTMRYPWDVALQDSGYNYPRPVDERFYGFDKGRSLVFVDGKWLEICKRKTLDLMDDDDVGEAVKQCLDDTAALVVEQPGMPQDVVVVLFYRQRADGSTVLLGTGTDSQMTNVLKFFDGQVVQVFGDSTGPGVTGCLRDFFGPCTRAPVERKVASHYCGGMKQQQSSRDLGWNNMNETYNIFLGMDDYSPAFVRSDHSHRMMKHNLTEYMKDIGMIRSPGWTSLRGLSIIIQFPFAHTQSNDMMLNRWDDVVVLETVFPEFIMTVQSKEGRETLAEYGYELKHLIVFDGLPQYNPSVTSGYPPGVAGFHNGSEFLKAGGYKQNKAEPAWIPEFGSQCRGPVPTSSKIHEAHMVMRTSFEDLGLDMQFYIRNWEFSNQFWWLVNGWGSKGLDCTHGSGGYYCSHKYLFQATIDDYYENFTPA